MFSSAVNLTKCRIEILADMKQAATDCRSVPSGSYEGQASVIEDLWTICPDATVEELRQVLKEAMEELDMRISFYHPAEDEGTTMEIQDWLEAAKCRLANLDDVENNISCNFRYPAPRVSQADATVVQLFYPGPAGNLRTLSRPKRPSRNRKPPPRQKS